MTNNPEFYLSRRALLAVSLNAGAIVGPAWAQISSATGIAALDTAAIRVKAPDCTFTVAVARAGNRLVAVGIHGVVIYSDDSGATWRQASVPVDVTLTCIAFATPMLGWAAGNFGVILTTVDGGESWQEQLNGIQINQLALTAAKNIPGGDTSSPAFELGFRRASFFVQLGPDKPLLTMIVLSPQNVMAFGAYRMAVFTTDGGKTWTDMSLQIYDRLSNNLYGVAMIRGKIYIAAEAGLVFCSTDGGHTFRQVKSPVAATLFGVLGAPDGSVIVYGVAGQCFRSVDQGHSWTPIALATQDDLTSGHLLSSGAIVIACGSGGAFESLDNGASFKPIADLPPLPISDFTQAPDGSFVFVGGAGAFKAPAAIFKN